VWTQLIGYPEERIAVVPNGFDFVEMENPPEGFRPLRELLSLTADELVVGCMGSIYNLKNPLMFVDVAASVVASGSKAHFVWVGDGPMRPEVERAIDRYGLRRVVHVLGRRADAPWLAHDFQIGVMTSLSEGLSNAIMEYMFWGIPVVTTDVGGCRELVEHQGTGFLVRNNDSTAMAAHIRKLLQDPTAASEMGRRGREKLEKQFSAEVMLAKTVAVYEAAGLRKQVRSTPNGLIGSLVTLANYFLGCRRNS
jgi:glycosyltransferase involved in cell wall biosynthesis